MSPSSPTFRVASAFSGSLLRAALVLAFPCFTLSCPRRPAPTQDPQARCEAACRSVGCGAPIEECTRHCLVEVAAADGEGCARELDQLLSCVAAASAKCSAPCAGAGCLGPPRVTSCEAPRVARDACRKPCQGEGTSHHLTRRLEDGGNAQLEVVRAGCAKCVSEKASGSAPGAPCAAASVCDRVCCQCDTSAARHYVRACVSGRCAGETLACTLARRHVAELCAPR